VVFRESAEKIKVSLKSDKYNGYFTWWPMYIYGGDWLKSFLE